jgi:TonB family protein
MAGLLVATAAGPETAATDAGTATDFGAPDGGIESGPIEPAVEAECAAIEPSACHQRALELLREGGGSQVLRAIGLFRSACRRGLAESCVVLRQATRPKAIVSPRPQYTRRAAEQNVIGTCVVKCHLPVDGRPRDCEILRSVPEMNQEVLSALRSARYEPATIANIPAEVSYVWNFHLSLPGRTAPPPPDWSPVLYLPLVERCAGQAAAACTAEATRLANNRERPEDADRAARLFGAACDQAHKPACEALRHRYVGPQRLDILAPDGVIPSDAQQLRGELVCWVAVTGEVQRCRVTKSTVLDEILLNAISKVHFRPAQLDGKSFETEYGFAYGPPVGP